MGQFAEPDEVMNQALPAARGVLCEYPSEVVDNLFVVPAEDLIANHLNLNLTTEGYPEKWEGKFTEATRGPALLAEYRAAYKRAVILQVSRSAIRAAGEISRSFKGASANYGGPRIHPDVEAIMEKYAEPDRWYRA